MWMKTILNLSGALLTAGLLPGAVGAQGAPVRVERQAALMGTVLRAEVVAVERATGFEALEAAFAEVRRLEGVLSSWTAESEVGRLNAAPVGEPVALSPELAELLAEAVEWSRSTGGAFDPAVGALVDAWELRGAGRRPSEGELAAALRASGTASYRLDADGRELRRAAPGAWLDTGGFGKGAALRAAERVLRARGIGAARLDFGGQVLVYGPAPAGEASWEVPVAHPMDRGSVAAAVRVRRGSVATTAQSERYVEVDGERYGHVLDPRTGRPVPAWGSVTVVAADPVAADALSTALFVMGPEEGRRWAAGREEGVLFLEVRSGAVVGSWNAAFEQYRGKQQTTSES